MQEDINQKTIAVSVKTAKVTGRVLRALLRQVLKYRKEHKAQKQAEEKYGVKKNGKQSLKELKSRGEELENIEINEDNIKSFERCARKFDVDYSLKRVVGSDPPKFYVFFRAKDNKSMDAAFDEYTNRHLNRNKHSVRKRLQKTVAKVLPHRERTRKRERTDSR